MVKVQRARRADPEIPSRPTQDICGLLLFVLGAACLLALSWPQQAWLPENIDASLRLRAGPGAYAVALLLLFAGTMCLI